MVTFCKLLPLKYITLNKIHDFSDNVLHNKLKFYEHFMLTGIFCFIFRLLPATGVPWWCNSWLPHNKAPLWRSTAALSWCADWPAFSTCQQHHLCLASSQVWLPQVLQGHLSWAFPRHWWLCTVSVGEKWDARHGFRSESFSNENPWWQCALYSSECHTTEKEQCVRVIL